MSANETDQLRTLLAAVAEALDVPLGEDIDEARVITRNRAVMARQVILDALDGIAEPAVAARVLHRLANAEDGAK